MYNSTGCFAFYLFVCVCVCVCVCAYVALFSRDLKDEGKVFKA